MFGTARPSAFFSFTAGEYEIRGVNAPTLRKAND
jgi:hypothetical protein